MNATARPWRLVTDGALELAATALREAAQGWQALWCVSATAASQVRVARLAQPLSGTWLRYDAAGDEHTPLWASYRSRDESVARVVLGNSHALALASHPDDLAWEVVAEAGDALLATCVDALSPGARAAGEAPLPRELALPGSGYVLCELPGWGLRIVVAAPRHDSRARSTAPVKLVDALARQSVRLSVVLGEVELSVGELASLCAGDVVRLNTRLGDALALRGPANEAVALVQPARRGEHLAVTLTDPHPEAAKP
ncbi:FliM/FliN family flagellar motor switch protein [Niveibacterium sp. COAC-50]|uniref:FliM/FliN family flagellar motor switch protein n=1 Tax=Niveibacterium sp. COAC-50 TaxID=2729384 RepID=UPI0015547A17|nr:FliM/FliN family flagellar motor switch protein [Niveibacterium sp. COAC-50]